MEASIDSEGAGNRFIIVLLALVVIFAAALAVTLAWGAPDRSIERIADVADWLRRHNDRETKLIVTLGGVVVILAMLMAIIVELTPSPTQRMRVRNVKAGDATITTRALADWIDADVRQVDHIAECRSIVAARGRCAEVVLELHVDAGADLARVSEDACARVRQLVERRIGVELAAPPRARLHYRELRLRSDAENETRPLPESQTAVAQEERD